LSNVKEIITFAGKKFSGRGGSQTLPYPKIHRYGARYIEHLHFRVFNTKEIGSAFGLAMTTMERYIG